MSGILVSDRRLFETVDGKIVGEDHPEAHRLVAACAGDEIDPEIAKRLELEVNADGCVCQAGDVPAGARSAGLTKPQIIEALRELGQEVKTSALKPELAAQLDAIPIDDPPDPPTD